MDFHFIKFIFNSYCSFNKLQSQQQKKTSQFVCSTTTIKHPSKAQIQRRGFIKTIVNKSVVTTGKTTVSSTALQFFKTVPCSRVGSVEEEIRARLPEAWGPDVSKRVVSAVSRAMDFDGKVCTAGIEVHLPREDSAARKEKRDSQPKPCDDLNSLKILSLLFSQDAKMQLHVETVTVKFSIT